MGNRIRIKQIDLQGVFSASAQVDLLSGSNYVAFVNELNTTMSSDVELAAVSSSISQSIFTINQTLQNGLVSGSSQLTSSYDTRYVLSGSITQTTWDNISGKPSGLVSQSTDLSSINTFTQSIDSRVDNLESWSSSLDSTFATDLQVSIVSSSVAATIGVISQNTGLVSTSSFNEYTASQSTASLVDRLNTIESVTSSYETKGRGIVSGSSQLTGSFDVRYTLSGSVTQTTWDNISGKPSGIVSSSIQVLGGSGVVSGSYETIGRGIVSSSAQISGLGFITSSTDISSLNAFTASYFTNSSSFDSRITTEKGRIDAILSASTADADTFAEIVTLINSVDTTNDNAFATYYTSSNARISSLESVTSSYETKGRGIVSGSSQLTSSFDVRYTLSGSVQPLPSGLFSSSAQLPSGLVSGSSQLTASYDTRYTLSGSVSSTPAGTISGSSQLTSSFDGRYVQTGSFNSFTASALTTGSNSFNGNQTITGSLIVSSVAVVNGAVTIPTGSTISLTSGSNLFVDSSGAITGSLTGSVFGIGDVVAFSSSINTRINNITSSATPAGTISGSSQLTASFDVRYTLSGSVGATPAGTISGSSQLTSSFDTRYLTIDGDGVISGSSQLTASLDTRYAASGSGGGTIPAGTISGSSQLTASYDGRYIQTGSFNSFTASIKTWTSSIATTGSNTFNGNQTITGSLNLTNGNIVASQITANTSSLYLTSGSNLYVQNNGLVEITGSLNVSGSNNINLVSPVLQIGTGSGDEGGEILLAKAVTNTTLTGSGVTVDVYRDRIRLFEQGGDARGVYIDLAKTPGGVAGELMWKASGMVNAGTFVTLDNIKAQVPASGNRGLSLATVSGTVTGYISGHYQGIMSSSAGTSSTTSLSTTATSSMFSWNFGQQGDMSTYILRDDTNNRVYRIILIIGAAYNNNFISIERLY